MTLRRNIDLNAMSDRLRRFEEACDNAPATLFEPTRVALAFVGEQCDSFINQAREAGLGVCNSDSIREIESLMFNMLTRKATSKLSADLECAEFYGNALAERNFSEQDALEAMVTRNAPFLKTLDDWKIVVAEQQAFEVATEEQASSEECPMEPLVTLVILTGDD